jgi:hypothetical protein
MGSSSNCGPGEQLEVTPNFCPAQSSVRSKKGRLYRGRKQMSQPPLVLPHPHLSLMLPLVMLVILQALSAKQRWGYSG